MNEFMKRYLVIGMAIACAIGIFVFLSKKIPVPQRVGAQKQSGGNVKGPLDAPITILEFSDFQCPSCARSEEPLEALLSQFPDLIQIHYKYFPLEMHPAALDAAKSADCAAEQNSFWDYHNLLFKEQSVWSRDPDPKTLFLSFANQIHSNLDSFQKCLENSKTLARINQDKQAGQTLEVHSTPTFFINGERLVGAEQLMKNGPQVIQTKLNALIQGKGKT